MRGSILGLFAAAALLALPLPARALVIQFCVPNCTNPTSTSMVQSQPGQTTSDTTGITTTIVPIAAFNLDPFTITATVTAQQSSTLQKISFNPTTIAANANGGCTTTNPCRMEIVATSEPNDFPLSKLPGGYPAGVYMMGSFTGPEVALNGDTISMTGEASGISVNTDTGLVTIINTDVINATPSTGPANIGVSLPSTCTGDPACKFMATTLKKAFSTQITDTVQQVCADGAATCQTQLRTHLNVEIKTAGNKVSLPLDHITVNVDPTKPQINPTAQLISTLAPPFSNLDVNSLAIGPSHFALSATMKLGNGEAIDPAGEEVFLSVGPFSLTVLPGNFKRLQSGKLYQFAGKVDGHEVVMTFARDRDDASLWTIAAQVHQLALTGVPQPPLQVPVQIGVGSDLGSELVTARFF